MKLTTTSSCSIALSLTALSHCSPCSTGCSSTYTYWAIYSFCSILNLFHSHVAATHSLINGSFLSVTIFSVAFTRKSSYTLRLFSPFSTVPSPVSDSPSVSPTPSATSTTLYSDTPTLTVY